MELDDIAIGEDRASRGHGGSEFILAVGAVDVDEPFTGIDSRPCVKPGFETFEAKNPTGDQVGSAFFFGELGKMPTGGYTAPKNRPGGCSLSDLFDDFMQSEGRSIRTVPAGWRILARGDGKSPHEFIPEKIEEFLLANGDD